MEKTQENIQGIATQETIAAWKNQHRKVHIVVVDDDGEKFAAYFKRPDMDTISAVVRLSKTDEIKGSTTLFDNCWLGGSEMIRQDAVLKMAVIGKLGTLLEGCKAELKNL